MTRARRTPHRQSAGMDIERARGIRFEADYWQATLTDLGGLNDQTVELAGDLANASVALLSLMSLTDDRANEFVRDGLTATNDALKKVGAMQESVLSILRLTDGRAKALRAELDSL
jgi:hypothetical protein